MRQPAIPPGERLDIAIDRQGEDAVLRVAGRINVDSSPDFRDHLRAVLSEEPPPRTVTVDLAGVPYIETSGVATLIEALRVASHRNIRLNLRGLCGAVLRLFEVTGVKAMFEATMQEQKIS
ncbi:MAG TPA: STAS domain-containing protein [Candidatus Binatia bacterium]|nr:STAS domain-containing protein [Candidatus Binatia bacterium]